MILMAFVKVNVEILALDCTKIAVSSCEDLSGTQAVCSVDSASCVHGVLCKGDTQFSMCPKQSIFRKWAVQI